MSGANFSGAPFGSNVSRFPNKLSRSTSERLGPGCYDNDLGDFSAKAVANRSSGPGWARAYELENMTALPYLLHKEEHERKLELPRKLGPGTYSFRDSLETPPEKVFTRGLLDMRACRFREDKSTVTPGPGTYGRGGIPDGVLEDNARKSFGTVQLLERGGTGNRSLPLTGSHIGPGTYNLTGSVDELLTKKTGSRGPYEVFTIDRSKPILTGHYAHPIDYNLGPGQYNLKASVDEVLTGPVGKFGIADQYPRRPTDRIIASTLSLKPREPSEPGPGQYEPKDVYQKPLAQSAKWPPFLSSSQRSDKMATKFFTGNHNAVGPGRYDIQKRDNAQDVNGCQSVFKSKTDRPSGLRLRVLSERLAGGSSPTRAVPGADQRSHCFTSNNGRTVAVA